jgi:hypothetical protein
MDVSFMVIVAPVGDGEVIEIEDANDPVIEDVNGLTTGGDVDDLAVVMQMAASLGMSMILPTRTSMTSPS